MSLRRIPLLLALVGAALVLAGLLIGPDSWQSSQIEGAYFTRAAGTPAYEGVFSGYGEGPGLLSAGDGNLWLGAGIACCTMALAAFVATRRKPARAAEGKPREPGDAPPA